MRGDFGRTLIRLQSPDVFKEQAAITGGHEACQHCHHTLIRRKAVALPALNALHALKSEIFSRFYGLTDFFAWIEAAVYDRGFPG